jgi:hypothetical protein
LRLATVLETTTQFIGIFPVVTNQAAGGVH